MLAPRIVWLYTLYSVILSYRNKGLKKYADTGSKAGIQPKHEDRLRHL